uniref:Farnesoic acid O-methyl transferase domain-containing protein n=1 Tax=Anopheles coluzzii TaxID=1518534 RepID=A0A8W7PWK2_ANOCL
MASRSAPLLPLLVAAFSLLFPLTRAQTGTNFPASEFTYGSFSSNLVICYSNTINSQSIRLTPVTRTFSFTPGSTQTIKYIQIMSPDLKKFYAQIANGGLFDTVRYIQIMSPDLKKFYAQIVNGGIGTGFLSSLDIVVSSIHGGLLNVAVRIFCGSLP